MIKQTSESPPGLELSCGFRRLRVAAGIGVYGSEIGRLQTLVISLRLGYGPAAAGRVVAEDEVNRALDYARAADLVRAVCGERHHGLLEFLAGRILERLLAEFPDCRSIRLTIEKPGALADAEASFCELAWLDSGHSGACGVSPDSL